MIVADNVCCSNFLYIVQHIDAAHTHTHTFMISDNKAIGQKSFLVQLLIAILAPHRSSIVHAHSFNVYEIHFQKQKGLW